MKYFSLFVFIVLSSCNAQINSKKIDVKFEDIYHHYFTLTPEKYLVLDSQEKLDKIYSDIGNHYGGDRKPPIPQVTADEKYIIFKPSLKNTNDVQVIKVEVLNETLYINVKPSENPDVAKTSRISPNILIKVYSNQDLKKVIISTLN